MRLQVRAQRHTSMLLGAVACLACVQTISAGQQKDGTPEPKEAREALTAEQVALELQQHNRQREAALLHYESKRVMTLEYSGFMTDKRATERVNMVYTAPGLKAFTVLSSTGSGLLRDNVFEREMEDEKAAATPDQRQAAALTPANYTLHLAGMAHLAEGECYVLDVTPRTTNRFAYTGRVWVQSTDFAVVRIDAVPRESPSFWVHDGTFTATFGKVDGFWLPKETISNSRIRLGGRATFKIEFGPYRILEAHPVISPEEHP